MSPHMKEDVLSELIKQIGVHTGKMTVKRGDEHVFLVMKIEFNGDETVNISMKKYVEESITDFPEEPKKKSSTPARKDLFTVDEDSPLLDKIKKKKIHSLTMKLMYVCQRARPDIMITIAFSCTRVSRSTDQGKKLRRLMEYLQVTINEELTLGAGSLDKIGSFVDVSFAVHQDMRSHTGGGISFGRDVSRNRK